MSETENIQIEPEDMEEPTLCPHCYDWFDAALPDNMTTVPFHLTCDKCDANIWPELHD